MQFAVSFSPLRPKVLSISTGRGGLGQPIFLGRGWATIPSVNHKFLVWDHYDLLSWVCSWFDVWPRFSLLLYSCIRRDKVFVWRTTWLMIFSWCCSYFQAMFSFIISPAYSMSSPRRTICRTHHRWCRASECLISHISLPLMYSFCIVAFWHFAFWHFDVALVNVLFLTPYFSSTLTCIHFVE